MVWLATTFGVVATISILFYCYNRFWQKEHTLLITHPFTGPFRYFFDWSFEYVRPHLHKDWEGRPFNRLTRTWIRKSSRGRPNYISFGSEINPDEPGTIIFSNSTFPILEEDAQKFPGKWIGKHTCKKPYFAKSFFNITGMSYGALGATAVEALARGSSIAGIWMNTGEGGLSEYHLHADNIVFQIGTAKYGCRNKDGSLSVKKLKELAALDQVRMFEIKLGQGAKPGSGGILPAQKVTPQIAKVRGISEYKAAISPNRHKEIDDIDNLMKFTKRIRDLTDKPVGIKIVGSGDKFLDRYFSKLKRNPEYVPDFITVDGTEGGTGAAPQSLADHVGLPLSQALRLVIDKLNEYEIRDKVKVIASAKLVTPDKVAWAMCIGADFVVSGRGFMMSLGCIQAMKCASGKCPKGITTNDPRYMNALDPIRKSSRAASYAKNVIHDVETIAHSCGLTDPSGFTRSHARIVTGIGRSKSLAQEFPYTKRRQK